MDHVLCISATNNSADELFTFLMFFYEIIFQYPKSREQATEVITHQSVLQLKARILSLCYSIFAKVVMP